MKLTFTKNALLLLLLVPLAGITRAQFFNHLPGLSSYLRADVRPMASGLLFNYTWQDSTLAIKTLLLYTGNNGQPVWMKEAGPNFGSYTLLPDSSVVITGAKTLAGGTRNAVIQKADKQGNILWKKAISSSASDTYIGNVLPDNGNHFYATVTRSSFSSSTYYSRAAVARFDSAGQIMWTKYFANPTFTTDYSFSRTLLAANGDFIGVADIRGSSSGPANGMMVTRITPQGTISFSKYIDFRTTHNQLSVTGLAETATGDIIFGGRLMTDQISTYPNAMWIGKMNSTGDSLRQRIYSGGEDVGEMLHSLRYANGRLYAYVFHFAPFDSVQRAFWVGELNEQTLSFNSQNAMEIAVTQEDPYGNVANSFCISSDGKPTIAGGFYCQDLNKNLPVMLQWSGGLAGNCTSREKSLPYTDSAASYVVSNYTPQSSFTISSAADTTVILLTNVTPVVPASLCNGCTTPAGINPLPSQQAFRIYPNPGNGFFHIDFTQPVADGMMRIYSNMGALVHQSRLQAATHTTADLAALPAGVYYIRVDIKNGVSVSGKLVKDR